MSSQVWFYAPFFRRFGVSFCHEVAIFSGKCVHISCDMVDINLLHYIFGFVATVSVNFSLDFIAL